MYADVNVSEIDVFFFFFKQKTAYEMLRSLVGSEMCIRDRTTGVSALVGTPEHGSQRQTWVSFLSSRP